MKKISIIIVFTAIFFADINAQELVDIKGTSTCETALDISRFKRFGPTTAPVQYGAQNTLNFEREKYPTWYKFTIEENGLLLFDIIPTNPQDNYNFMLFKATDNFCADFNKGAVKALRANFGPSQKENYGYTGLSYESGGRSYEAPVKVRKGEVYYLALNNEYSYGSGHTIAFSILNTYKINGHVYNGNNNPVKAEVTWKSLYNSNIYISNETNKKGEYELEIAVNNNSHTFPKYECMAYADKYFPDFRVFSTEEASKLDGQIINFKLQKIKKGHNNKTLGIIYFEPNEFIAVAKSDTVMQKLLKTMLLNEKAEIILEGHTNGLYPSTQVDMKLSQERAEAIKRYLTENGIMEQRIQVKGYGSTKEVYPTPKNEEEEGFNRRVEVNFVKF